jgi:hypothetical protein
MSDSAVKSIFTGAIAGLIIFSGTTFYSDFVKQPRIDIGLRIMPNTDNDSVLNGKLTIRNTGGASANHMRVTLVSNSTVDISVPVFQSEEITGPNSADGSSCMELERLSPASGITMNAMVNQPRSNATALDIFANYDEGSKQKNFLLYDGDLKSKEQSNIDLTTPIISSILAGIVFLICMVYLRIKKTTVLGHRQLIEKLRHDMCIAINLIKKEPNYSMTLSGKFYSIYLWNRETDDAKRNLFKTKFNTDDDYNNIEDFIQAITIRDNAVKENKVNNGDQLTDLNNNLAKKAIENVTGQKLNPKEISDVSQCKEKYKIFIDYLRWKGWVMMGLILLLMIIIALLLISFRSVLYI